MVGFVIVSHSETLANGVVELTKMMADGVPIRAAGGLDGGGFGTSYEKISNQWEMCQPGRCGPTPSRGCPGDGDPAWEYPAGMYCGRSAAPP